MRDRAAASRVRRCVRLPPRGENPMFEIELIYVFGRRYDPRVLAAPMEFLALVRAVERATTPDRSGLTGVIWQDLEWTLRFQAMNVHAGAENGRGTWTCT